MKDPNPKLVRKRQLIRAAAYRCFAKRGYHQTSVDDICRAAKISKGSYYWHYETKQSVLFDILDVWAAAVENDLQTAFHAALSSADPYSEMTRALAKQARRHRHLLPVWMDFLGQGTRDPEIKKGLARFHRRIRESLTVLLRPLLGVAIVDDELRALSGSMLACFVGLVCQDLVDPDEGSFEKQIGIFMSTLERLIQQARFGRVHTAQTLAQEIQ